MPRCMRLSIQAMWPPIRINIRKKNVQGRLSGFRPFETASFCFLDLCKRMYAADSIM